MTEERVGEGQTLITGAGTVRIAEEVVATVAGIAATEIEGVTGMSGTLASGLAEVLGMKTFTKGVKVQVGEQESVIDLFLVVDYGVCIPDIAARVQENVRAAVSNMTGLEAVEVNVHVQGIGLKSHKE